jgi:hypothetical protein
MMLVAERHCLVTQGERCNPSSITPSAMTIIPVRTILILARALELRSNICAMRASLLDFLFGCARRDGGHIICVHFFSWGTTHPGGGEALKFNIPANGRVTAPSVAIFMKKSLPSRFSALWRGHHQI